MQGFEFIIMFALVMGCQPRVKTKATQAEPAALSEDQKPTNTSCRAVSSPAKQLSQTGCVRSDQPQQPAAGVIAYDLIAPLWSDGSLKQRFLAVPDGKTGIINARGHIELPVGSVTMKTFALEGKPIETRLFMQEALGRWRGYSYEWRADGSDADLLDTGKEKLIAGQTWVYPSRAQCDMCHNKASEITLGLTASQLLPKLPDLKKAGVLAYEDTQIPESKLVDYRNPEEPIEARARSYLQGNCAFCHQPNGGGVGNFDFRIQNDFAQMGICNTPPFIDVFPVTDAKIFKPGVPSASVLILRMKDEAEFHMPPQVSRKVDTAGVSLMEKWTLVRSNCLD